MAQATSNLLQQPNYFAKPGVSNYLSPIQSALTNKINPPPITPAKGSVINNSQSVGNVGSTGGYNTVPTAIKSNTSSNSGVISNINPNQQYNQVTAPPPASKPPVTPPSTTSNTNTQNNAVDANGNPIQIGNPSLNQGTGVTYPGLVNQIAQGASQPGQAYTTAMQNAEEINRQLAQSKINLGNQLSANAQNPIPLEFQQGRGQILTNQGLAQQNALSSELSGATNLLGAANTQQGLQQSGLISAAGLAAPRQNGYVLINPQTGGLMGGNGTSGGSAINQGAQYDAQYAGALANATDNQAIAGAQNNIDAITQLIQNSNLNGQKLNIANETYQTLQKNLSNSDYQTLNNALGAINAALTKVTGSPVDVGQLSTTQGTSLITTINNQVQVAKAIAAGKINGGNTNTGTTQSSSGGLYNF